MPEVVLWMFGGLLLLAILVAILYTGSSKLKKTK